MIGCAPFFLLELKASSPMSLSFYRFFGSAIIEFALILLVLLVLNHQIHEYIQQKSLQNQISFRKIFKQVFFQYYSAPNPYFRNRSQIFFLMWLGFDLIVIVIPTYYLSFTLIGLIITTIVSNVLTVLGLSMVNWIKKEEKMDLLKIIYLSLLIAAVLTIAFSTPVSEQIGSLTLGILVLIISTVAYILYILQFGYDHSRKILLLRDLGLPRDREKTIEKSLVMLRALLKLFAIHFLGSLLLLPIAGLLWLFFPMTLLGSMGETFISIDLLNCLSLLQNPSILGLILISTTVPYFLIIFSSTIWPRDALKHNTWTSIFALVEPLVGLYIGWLFWEESIRVDYIIFTTILIVASILIRYFHETVNVRKVLFLINHGMGYMQDILLQISKIKEVDRIDFLTGDYDFLVVITVRSMARLAEIAIFIEQIPGVITSTYTIETQSFLNEEIEK
jgi:hypothetical protein